MDIKSKLKAYFTKENMKKEMKDVYETIVFVIVALILIRFFIFEPRVIPSASMHPTLIEGDRLIIERYSRFFTSPKRGDIIVFYPPQEYLKQDPLSMFERLTGFFCKDIAYIKRVIGVGGDNIEIKKETDETFGVYVNGQKIQEPYIKSPYEYPVCTDDMNCKITLKKDEFFVMGDNRGNSYDSRFWGVVGKKRIVGVTKLRFWPLNRLHYFAPVKY
ncbi:signal peptidase I [bacterium]|nr:signal peptidase I [bacterium]